MLGRASITEVNEVIFHAAFMPIQMIAFFDIIRTSNKLDKQLRFKHRYVHLNRNMPSVI